MRLEKGFAPLIIMVIVTIVIGAGVGGFLVFQKNKARAPEAPIAQKAMPQEVSSPNTEASQKLLVPQLGTLCSGEDGCNAYCKNNFGRCTEYCHEHSENALCPKPLSFEVSPAREAAAPAGNGTIQDVAPLPVPPPALPPSAPTPVASISPTPKFETAQLQPWVTDSITQPVPSGASKTRLTSFPAPLDKMFITGPYGAHRGGHPEGLDHEWIEIKNDVPVGSWADGDVTRVFLNNPNDPTSDWRIYIDYGDGLSGELMDVKTPLVKTGDKVKAGQAIAYGVPVVWLSGYHAGEFNLVDKHRGDGVRYRDGVTVSPFDYLREDLKQELIAAYTKQFIEPYTERGEFFMGFAPWEPYLTNPLVFHKQYRGTLAGEWYLKSRAWAVDDVPDAMTLVPANTKYYSKQHFTFGEDASGGGATYEGTWEVDSGAGLVRFNTTDQGTFFGIYALDESGPRALLKIEYATSSYPSGFSEKANTYIERDAIQRREDGYRLGVREGL